MPLRKDIPNRRKSRSQAIAQVEQRRPPRRSSARTQPTPAVAGGRRTEPLSEAFLIFCIQHVLTSGSLVSRSGRGWQLHESVAGVNAGETFVSLSSCAQAMIAALKPLYARGKAA